MTDRAIEWLRREVREWRALDGQGQAEMCETIIARLEAADALAALAAAVLDYDAEPFTRYQAARAAHQVKP